MYYYNMEKFVHRYKTAFTSRDFNFSLAIALVSLVLAFSFNYFTSNYATEHAGNQVTDIVLSNIPIFNVDTIFIYGPVVLWLFFVVILLNEPKRIPFALKSVALFIVIRAIFTTMTHLGPYPYDIPEDFATGFARTMTFGGDLFFSGHTGLPFLMALMLGGIHKYYYFVFIGAAVFFGAIVLLGHYHYTIDVAAAFFITYSIYVLSCKWFKKDMKAFYSADEGMVNGI